MTFKRQWKHDGLLLASLPSSGSDWIAECMRGSCHSIYWREFFCPTVNWKYSDRLMTSLGDTLYSTVPNLCRQFTENELDRLLEKTWRQEEYCFTKENYLAFQLSEFAKTFTVVILLRRFKDTFPPRRHRVMQWYEHFFGALRDEHKIDQWLDRHAITPMNCAAIGHFLFVKQMKNAGTEIGSPIMWFHDLVDLDQIDLQNYVKDVPVNPRRFAELIIESRNRKSRPGGQYADQWKDAFHLYGKIEDRYGES